LSYIGDNGYDTGDAGACKANQVPPKPGQMQNIAWQES
jgi:hypothetical protein